MAPAKVASAKLLESLKAEEQKKRSYSFVRPKPARKSFCDAAGLNDGAWCCCFRIPFLLHQDADGAWRLEWSDEFEGNSLNQLLG